MIGSERRLGNFGALILAFGSTVPALGMEVGFGKADITPDVEATNVWLAGYGQNRKATGVHDPIWARAAVLRDGEDKIALVSTDLIGLQYEQTLNVRNQLEDYRYVLVASTHNHEGPDVIGLWGPSPTESGADPEYLGFVEDKIVEAVRQAEANLKPAEAAYGTAEDETLLHDSRLPIVRDGVLRLLVFTPPDRPDGVPLGILVQWNCHPENLGGDNTQLTADFPYYTIRDLERRYGCPVALFTGAIGGLMSAPEDKLQRDDGTFYKEGEFEFAEVYGNAVAKLADEAIRFADPIELTPFGMSAVQVTLPLRNNLYRAARAAGVLDRMGYVWAGDPFEIGEERPGRVTTGEIAILTEVAYLNLGEFHIAAIPGEIYPELVLGEYQEPVEPNVDFPDAPLEPSVRELIPDGPALILGLANDEVGYIIPKRQWDQAAPFAYGRERSQYGEINSVGPEVAPILMKALGRAVEELESP